MFGQLCFPDSNDVVVSKEDDDEEEEMWKGKWDRMETAVLYMGSSRVYGACAHIQYSCTNTA